MHISLSLVLVSGAAAPASTDARGAAVGELARPNVVFLLTDDQRWDALGCMGNAVIETPHLDRLAAEGLLFTNVFCTTSICATSRASFLTGQYARRHAIHDFRTPLSADAFAQTFPAVLSRHGYRTGFVGKWGLGGALPEVEFDFWAGFPGQGRYFGPGHAGHLTRHLGNQALEFVQTCDAGRPFLLCVSFKAPHVQDGDSTPFQPDPAYEHVYREVEIPLPATASAKAFARLPEFLQHSEGRARWQQRFATSGMYQASVKNYYRLITGVDRVVGRLVAALKARGFAKQTVIVVSSDNGFFLGEHGLAGKWFMYEESIRVPLIIFDPRAPASTRGRRVEPPVLTIDVAPTILELAGISAPRRMQGGSLAPFVRGLRPEWRTEWFYEHLFEHPRIPRSEGVHAGRFKYVRYLDSRPPYEQLFDLARDPAESHNLAADAEHATKLEHMRKRWMVLRDQLR